MAGTAVARAGAGDETDAGRRRTPRAARRRPTPSARGGLAPLRPLALLGALALVSSGSDPARADATGAARRLVIESLEATHDADRTRVIEATATHETVSLLLSIVLDDPAHTVGVARVTDPAGRTLHETRFADDSWEAHAFASVIASEPLVDEGELSLFLPVSPELPVRPGRYRIDVETDPADADIARVTLVTTRHRGAVPIDALEHAIDIRLVVLHPGRELSTGRLARSVDGAWRRALDAVLAPHRLRVGTLAVIAADRALVRRFATLDEGVESEAVCPAIRALPSAATASASRSRPLPEAVDGEADRRGDRDGGADADAGRDGGAGRRSLPSPALHVGLVDEIVDPHGEGRTTALAPLPGNLVDDASPDGCVLVAVGPWRDEDAPLGPLTVAALLAANLLHELGHFAGLVHTSEADGETFDPLRDTPRCERRARDGGVTSAGSGEPDGSVDEIECADGGGADNLMFWSGDAGSMPWTLSEGQAWLLRRHPLFTPLAPADAATR